MAKGGGKAVTNLLRISGLLFSLQGAMHLLRWANGWEPRLFVLTSTGSLVYAVCLIVLAIACFKASR